MGAIVSTAGGVAGNEMVAVGSMQNQVDNLFTVETVATTTTAGGALAVPFSEFLTYKWKPTVPYPMVNGSMIAVYLYTASSDSKWRFNMTWAEVPTTGR